MLDIDRREFCILDTMSVARDLKPVPGETADERDFRRRVRIWLDENAVLRTEANGELDIRLDDVDADGVTAARRFQATLYEAGLAGIGWPTEFGGQGLSDRYEHLFAREAARYLLPNRVLGIGLGMCGPTILARGSDEQRRRYLPGLLRGDDLWAQLFSEPDAGSDLASVRTMARRDGDQWVVDGQKVWTSGAHLADLGLLLARSDVNQPKHRGMTMFILDMRAPGVTVRPLRQMTGQARFNEVFLDGVVIKDEQRVGEVNRGWQAAMATLGSERHSVGGSSTAARAGTAAEIIGLVSGRAAAGSGVVRQALADAWIRERLLELMAERASQAFLTNRSDGPEGALVKLMTTRLMATMTRLAMSLVGISAIAWDESDPGGDVWAQRLCLVPGLAIAGGTDEVLLTTLGERILGLPKESRVDAEIPFRDTLAGRATAQWGRA